MELDSIAQAIRSARVSSGLTQKQVAEALDKSQTTVAAWEIGRSQPDAKTIVYLSRLLGVSTDYLLGLSSFRTSNSENILVAMFGPKLDTLPTHDKDALVGFITSLTALYSKILESEESSSRVFETVFTCMNSIVGAIKELVQSFETYKIAYSMSDKINKFNERLNAVPDNLRDKITSSSREMEELIEEFSTYSQEINKFSPSDFSRGTLETIDTASGALATLAIQLQSLLPKQKQISEK